MRKGERKKLTFKQHAANGKRLKKAYRLLLTSQVAILNGDGKTKPAARLINKVMNQFGALRQQLDNQISVDCPNVSNAKVNHVYYGDLS